MNGHVVTFEIEVEELDEPTGKHRVASAPGTTAAVMARPQPVAPKQAKEPTAKAPITPAPGSRSSTR